MQEGKDPAIRLFGKKIPLPADEDDSAVSGDELALQASERDLVVEEEETDTEKDLAFTTDTMDTKKDGNLPPETLPDSYSVNPKTPSINEELSVKPKTARSNEKEQNESTNNNDNSSSQEKALKKPDKILPCPRCNSMDTKFCYYNNYNVNQPRHFCKACQRYWTAGGTMRNVPVGAGRRKNKNSSAATVHYRHITISEALQATRIDAAAGPPPLPNTAANGRLLSFGLDSTAANPKPRNGFNKARENGGGVDDCSSASSVTVSNSAEEVGGRLEPSLQSVNGSFSSSIPCLPGVPWAPYPWNSAAPASTPAFCPPPGFPMSFYPYWNCAAAAAIPGGAWNIPWFPPPLPPYSSTNSSILGKHSREGDTVNPGSTLDREEQPPKQRNGSILVPKTLRIDDPSEAAKSSIWATLGIKNEGAGMFKAFQSKSDRDKAAKSNIAETSPVLRANPAALSRSLNFQEAS